MAVEYTKSIRGITYTQGQSFQARAAGTWYGAADGTRGSGSIASGHTCYFQYYCHDAEWYYYPYCINPNSSDASDQEWTSIDIFPFATYTVSYNANGGSGAPSSQTKTWGTALTLSSTKPTRSGYAFKGWATSSSSTTVAYAAGASYTANAAATLYAVWEATAATIDSVATMTTGSAVNIKWTPNNSTHKFILGFNIGNERVYTTSWITPGQATQYTYSGYSMPIATWGPKVPNTTSAEVTVYLYTYLSSATAAADYIGRASKTATLNIASTVVPSITAVTLSEGASGVGFTGWIKTLSKVRAVITASAGTGSTLKKYSLNVSGSTYTGSSSTITATNTLSKSGSLAVTVTVTDARGRTATNTQNITVIDYFKPTINSVVASVSGTTVTLKVKYAIASVSDQNSINMKIKRTRLSDSTSTTVTPMITSYSGTYTLTETLSDIDTETYEYTVDLWDSKTSSAHTVASTRTAVTALSLLRGGKGAAFFGEATHAGLDVLSGGYYLAGQNLLLDILHPVNSVVCVSTNTNPGTRLGGTWTLIDKEFSSYYNYTDTNNFIRNTTAITSITDPVISRSGHTVSLKITFVNTSAMSGTNTTVGTWDWSKVGISSIGYTQEFIGLAEGYGILQMDIASGTGVMRVIDVVARTGSVSGSTSSNSPIAAGVNCHAEVTFTVDKSRMLDSACDKFYFRRTA